MTTLIVMAVVLVGLVSGLGFAVGFRHGRAVGWTFGVRHGRNLGWLEYYEAEVAKDRARRDRGGRFVAIKGSEAAS